MASVRLYKILKLKNSPLFIVSFSGGDPFQSRVQVGGRMLTFPRFSAIISSKEKARRFLQTPKSFATKETFIVLANV